ncbi:hypothetical protein OHQ89_15435 [Streptomyces canus]|uniref:hypothetical protein n=1 Tax=Streptomyces canus TaxID=58343 RepID=UPI002E2D2614|nr:hypothetical protein [Streptomyces canus]
MSTMTGGFGREWDPRPPKPALRIWTRYFLQWLWGPLVWVLARIPLLLLTVLEIDVQGSGTGRARKPRWRRRIWVDRERLCLDRIRDPQEQERELRQFLADHRLNCVPPRPGAPVPLPCSGGKHRLGVDDCYYRLLGARRALDIAHNDFGWVSADGFEKKLPEWLQLRCP